MSLDEKIIEAKRKVQDALPDMLRLAIELNRGGNATLLSALAETFGMEKLVGPDIPKPDHKALDLAKVIELVREKLGEKPAAYERAFAQLSQKHGLNIMGVDWATDPDHTSASLWDQRPGGSPLTANDLDAAIAVMQAQASPRYGVPDRGPRMSSLFMAPDMAVQLRNAIQEQEAGQPSNLDTPSTHSSVLSMRGIQIITSEAVPPGSAYLINPRAMAARTREELGRLVARIDGNLEDR